MSRTILCLPAGQVWDADSIDTIATQTQRMVIMDGKDKSKLVVFDRFTAEDLRERVPNLRPFTTLDPSSN